MEEEEISLTFWGHLEELRSSLIKTLVAILLASFAAFYYSEELLTLLTEAIPPAHPLILISPQEGMISLFKLSFWGGALLSSPYWILLFFRFVRPAWKGKSFLPSFLLLSLLFLSAGIFVGTLFTLPLATRFFFQFNDTFGMNLWSLSHYLDYVWLLLIGHAAAFELGALLLWLIHTGVITPAQLAEKRRPACIASLILGALLTPPDALTQLIIALPLYGFFELSILYGNVISAGRRQDRACRDRPDRGATPLPDVQTPPEDL